MIEPVLSCYTRPDGRTMTLVFEGCLDISTAPRALEALQRHVLEHGPSIVLETTRLDFIDSRGVGVLIAGVKSARDAGGKIYLTRPAMPVQKILETCGLLSLFPPEPTPEPIVEEEPKPAASKTLASARSTPSERSEAGNRAPTRTRKRAAPAGI